MRIYKRYYRLAKKLGKNYREIEIDNKLYKDAFALELLKEEELIGKGEESRLRQSRSFDPEKIKGFTSRPERKDDLDWLVEPSDASKHSETCKCGKCAGGYSDPDLIGTHTFPESDERREARKNFEREINRQLEQACTSGICPVCKSSVCRCGED